MVSRFNIPAKNNANWLLGRSLRERNQCFWGIRSNLSPVFINRKGRFLAQIKTSLIETCSGVHRSSKRQVPFWLSRIKPVCVKLIYLTNNSTD
jgi:hypothetical protein